MPAEEDLEEDRHDQYLRRLAEGKRMPSPDDEEKFRPKRKWLEALDREDPSFRRRLTDGCSNDSTDVDVRRWK